MLFNYRDGEDTYRGEAFELRLVKSTYQGARRLRHRWRGVIVLDDERAKPSIFSTPTYFTSYINAKRALLELAVEKVPQLLQLHEVLAIREFLDG